MENDMTTVNHFTDILRIIREQPEWADALRSALLSQELLEMPQTLAEFAKATNQRLATLEGDVADLKAGQARLEAGQARLEAGQARLEAGQARLEGQIGNLRGPAYQLKVGNNVATIVRRPLGIERVRVLKGYKTSDDMAFHDLIDAARRQGLITEQQWDDVGNLDIVLQGQRVADRSTVYAALEVSITAADSDINRAASRADILARATGETAVPVVVSAHIDNARQRLAQERNVILIAYGE
jgi:hypothetical protein